MSQNPLKHRTYGGINVAKVQEEDRVVFGGRLYIKRNGGLKRATDEETREFVGAHLQRMQKREQQQ